MTPNELDDLRLTVALAQMWDELDPVPDGLTERVICTVAMRELDAEVELLSLVNDDDQWAGARGASLGYGDSQTLTFSNGRVSVMVAITAQPRQRVRVDGWVEPHGGGTVSVRFPDQRLISAVVDEDGRFEFDGLPRGLIRMEYIDPQGRVVAAPTFEL